MKKKLNIVIIVGLSLILFKCGELLSKPIYIKVHKEITVLPTEFISEWGFPNPNSAPDSATVAYMLRSRWYPYPDTVRYSYSEEDVNITIFSSNDFYKGDTVNIAIVIETLEDSVYFDVNDNLPDSIYFRIYKYSDFELTESSMDSVSTEDLTFIYRGKNDRLSLPPTKLDSNNFYIRKHRYTIFYDIVGLDSGIYEILPTFTIFPVDSQEYGYKKLCINRRQTFTGLEIYSYYRRDTFPIYIREKKGWIDSVNVYLCNAFRYTLAGNMDSAVFYNELALDIYPGSFHALRVRGWIEGMFFGFTVYGDYLDISNDTMKDWYMNRFAEINFGIAGAGYYWAR